MITVIATRAEPSKRLVIIAVFLKIFDRVRDTFKAIDATQFTIHTFVTEPITNGRACFHCLEPDAVGGQFIGHAGKSVSALQIHARRSGKIKHNQVWLADVRDPRNGECLECGREMRRAVWTLFARVARAK